MTPVEKTGLLAQFAAAYPKAIDFPQKHFELDKQDYYDAAERSGYRIAGLRLGRAVFTTKPLDVAEPAN